MKHWIAASVPLRWVGFAWFGWVRLKNTRTGKIIERPAGGVYCDNGRNVEFKISNFPEEENMRDYEVTHYITRPDKEINLFNVKQYRNE